MAPGTGQVNISIPVSPNITKGGFWEVTACGGGGTSGGWTNFTSAPGGAIASPGQPGGSGKIIVGYHDLVTGGGVWTASIGLPRQASADNVSIALPITGLQPLAYSPGNGNFTALTMPGGTPGTNGSVVFPGGVGGAAIASAASMADNNLSMYLGAQFGSTGLELKQGTMSFGSTYFISMGPSAAGDCQTSELSSYVNYVNLPNGNGVGYRCRAGGGGRPVSELCSAFGIPDQQRIEYDNNPLNGIPYNINMNVNPLAVIGCPINPTDMAQISSSLEYQASPLLTGLCKGYYGFYFLGGASTWLGSNNILYLPTAFPGCGGAGASVWYANAAVVPVNPFMYGGQGGGSGAMIIKEYA